MKTTTLFIIEEHHEAFFIWNYCVGTGKIKPSCNTLLHVDYHSDFALPLLQTSLYSLNGNNKAIKEFTYRELSISNFIAPAIYLGIFNEVFWIDQKKERKKSLSTDNIDFLPVNNENRVMKQKRVEGFLQSKNRDGKNLLIQELVPAIKAIQYPWRREFVYYYTNVPSAIFPSGPIVLDIDLDYFSCWTAPKRSIELKVEVTEEAYNLLQNPYHPVNLLEKRVVLEKSGKRFFVHFNRVDKNFHSNAKVDRDEILGRIDLFISFLKENNIYPQIIDICRSRYSGFTPQDQWEFIEKSLIEELSQLYSLEIVLPDDLQDIC